MAIERRTAKLPAGFDAAKHGKALVAMIISKHGDGWELESIDPVAQTATLTRQVALVEVTAATPTKKSGAAYPRKQVNLPRGTKPTDGDKLATKFEDQHPGFYLTKFEPWLGRAELTELPGAVARFRFAVATALGVKPWDIMNPVGKRGGGFSAILPVWQPSKHEQKLEEVTVSLVGKPGWWFTVNPATRQLDINPGELPTFPAAYPYPFDARPCADFIVPVGMGLGGSGRENFPIDIDLDGNSGILVSGVAGGGKSVCINSLIYGILVSGAQLAVLDVAHKKADFEWCRDFVNDHWWGCDSKAEAVTVLRLVYEEGEKRGHLIHKYGVQKYQELPEHVRRDNPPIYLVFDEVQSLFQAPPIPKSLPKDHPIRVEAEQEALETDLLKAYCTKMPAEMRFVGIRLILATQQAQSNTGIAPTVKLNLPNRLLMGANPTTQARGHAFQNPDAAPFVPEHIRADAKAARGSGVAELEGYPSSVFKGYFATVNEYRKRLIEHGVRQTATPKPTPDQVARMVPRIDNDPEDSGPPPSKLDRGGFGQRDGRDIAADDKLKGAAAAAHQMKMDAALARNRRGSVNDG